MTDIVLATLNARWSHASLGLRYLYANLGELQSRARIDEFTIATPLDQVVERLLEGNPRIIGFGVYIWNVERTTELIARLREVAPAIRIVIGGPEVSHEVQGQAIVQMADHVITGPADLSFAVLARQLLDGPRPLIKVIAGVQPELDSLVLPYAHYTDRDIAHRNLYIEASRGCPYKCEFCLSALDKTAWPFDLDQILDQLAQLHLRGARRFRFVDRTFNLKAQTGRAILDFFLQRIDETPDDPVFAHFELVPDHLPAMLREAIVRFPAGALQFEIGIQTWNPEVQARISRRQDNARAEDHLRWLREHSQAHLHVDLIAGLPGEDLASFGAGFDRLVALRPHEIQVGILKRLRGAPIARHTEAFGLRFSPTPPYQVIETDALSATDVARLSRFARYWDLYGNSGRFVDTLPRLLGEAPFARFMALSDWLHEHAQATHQQSLEARADALLAWMVDADSGDAAAISRMIAADYARSGAQGRPAFMARGLGLSDRDTGAAPQRQARHLAISEAAPLPPALPSAL